MTENNKQPAATTAAEQPPPTLEEIQREQAKLRTLITRRQNVMNRLVSTPGQGSLCKVGNSAKHTSQQAQEASIAAKESAYLENTPHGNILTGFDNYIKGTNSAAASRKKVAPMDQNKLFTNSSISYKPNDVSWTVPFFPSHMPL
jgi:chromatin modification-related protein EAF6